jgi:hypothetical protein
MGIPAPLPCAAPECQKHATPASAGVFFTPASLFSKDMPHEAQVRAAARAAAAPPAARSDPTRPTRRRPSLLAQLWACSVEHKRDALHEILKDLPYRHAKR